MGTPAGLPPAARRGRSKRVHGRRGSGAAVCVGVNGGGLRPGEGNRPKCCRRRRESSQRYWAGVVTVGRRRALAFSDTLALAVAGVLLWGAAVGVQDSTVEAVVADLVPPDRLRHLRRTATASSSRPRGWNSTAGRRARHSFPALRRDPRGRRGPAVDGRARPAGGHRQLRRHLARRALP
jgi:hypothetical protein